MDDILDVQLSDPQSGPTDCIQAAGIKMEWNGIEDEQSSPEVSSSKSPLTYILHNRKYTEGYEKERKDGRKEDKEESDSLEEKFSGKLEDIQIDKVNNQPQVMKKIKKCCVNCEHTCFSCNAKFQNISLLIRHLKAHKKPNNQEYERRLSKEVEDLQVATKNEKGCQDLDFCVLSHNRTSTKTEYSKDKVELKADDRTGRSRMSGVFISSSTSKMSNGIDSSVTEFSLTNYIQKSSQRNVAGKGFSGPGHINGLTECEQNLKTGGNPPMDKYSCRETNESDDLEEDKGVTMNNQNQLLVLEVRYKCGICGNGWNSYIEYENHIFTKHGTKCSGPFAQWFKCNICGKTCSLRSNFRSHLSTHIYKERKKSFKCDICGKGFYNRYDKERHKRTHNKLFEYSCDICGKRFCYKKSVKRHVCNQKAGKEVNSKKTFRSENVEKSIPCSVQKNDQKSNECNGKSSVAVLETPGGEKSLKKDNHQQFSNDGLNQTLEKTLGPKPSPEKTKEVTGWDLVTIAHDVESLGDVSKDDKTGFKCDICSGILSSSEHLRGHIYTQHATVTDARKGYFKGLCNVCGMNCRQKASLEKHLLTHTNRERSFKCTTCGKGFFRKDELVRHGKVHKAEGYSLTENKVKEEDETGVNGFCGEKNRCKCDICGDILSSTEYLRGHLYSQHTSISDGRNRHFKGSCNICGVTFSRKDSLERHLLTHTKRERSFKCPECGKGYFTKDDLGKHENIHKDVKNNCDICRQSFKSRRNLHYHKRFNCRMSHKIKSNPGEKTLTDQAYDRYDELGNMNVELDDMDIELDDMDMELDDMDMELDDKNVDDDTDVSGSCNMENKIKTVVTDDTKGERSSLEPICFPGKDVGLSSENSDDSKKNLKINSSQHDVSKTGDVKISHTENVTECFDNQIISRPEEPTSSVSDTNEVEEYDSTGVNGFQCDICGVIMSSSEYLKGHIYSQHTTISDGRKRHFKGSCNVCDLTFSRKDSLQRHVLTHTRRERSFKCSKCGKGFFTKESLGKHKHTHKAVVCHCVICKKPFKSTSLYNGKCKTCKEENKIKSSPGKGSPVNNTCDEMDDMTVGVDTELRCNGVQIQQNVASDDSKDERSSQEQRSCCLQKGMDLGNVDMDETKTNAEISTSHHVVSETKNLNISQKEDMTDVLDNQMISGSEEPKSFISDTNEEDDETVVNGGEKNSFQCDICGDILSSTEYLRGHLYSQHTTILDGKKGHFKGSCNVCGVTCSRKDTLERHLLLHTKRERSFKCATCGKGFYEKYRLYKHEKTHDGMTYDCDVCRRTFKSTVSLRDHMKGHRGELDHKCNNCGKSFVSFKILRGHQRTAHGPKKKCPVCNKMVVDLRKHKKTHADNPALKCEFCDKTLCDFRSLKKHRAIHMGKVSFVCELCGKGFFTETSHQRHVAKHAGEKRFVCDVCGEKFYLDCDLSRHIKYIHVQKKTYTCTYDGCRKTYASKKGFSLHVKTHTEKAKYSCHMCNKAYYDKHQLLAHVKSHTKTRNRIKCDECRSRFDSSEQLENHKQRIHRMPKWVCQKCKKAYMTKTNLEHHICIHDKAKTSPFLCEFCGVTYLSSMQFQLHLNNHMGVVVNRPHKCTTCNAGFFYVGKLKIHERIHTGERPFPCDICGKSFKSEGQRKLHKGLHKRERSFKCDDCGRMFFSQAVLKEHYRIHSGVKPNVCELCGERFRHNGTLSNHIRLVHKTTKRKLSNQ
ncbi:zinc finger protein 850-like [Argopecten irradians]|uniref:zinc finger protein 850-like n=1 Tax=Argopecten irradians TaxID=31199 RepID=UPI00372048D8